MKTNGTTPSSETPITTGIRIHSVKITNILGIRALSFDVHAGGAVFAGPNASGKSSAIEALRLCLTGQGVDPKAIRRDAAKGEVFVDMSHPSVGNLLVTRSISRKSGGKLEITGPDGVPLPAPATLLKTLLGASPICPLELWKAKPAEQRAMILSAMPSTVTAGQIMGWLAEYPISMGALAALLGGVAIAGDKTEIPGHGLEVIAKVREHFYAKRKAANVRSEERGAEATTARTRLKDAVETFGVGDVLTIEAAQKKLDDARSEARKAGETNAGVDAWEKRTAGTQIKIAGLRASVDLETHPLPVDPGEEEARAATGAVNVAERMVEHGKGEIAKIEEALRIAKGSLLVYEQHLAEAVAARRAVDGRHVAFFEARNKREQVLAQADALAAGIGEPPPRLDAETLEMLAAAVPVAEKVLARARGARALDAVREDADAAEKAAREARTEAGALDAVVKRLTNEAPGELAGSNAAIPGLRVTDTSFELNGVDVSTLSGKEKLFLATDVTRLLSPGRILILELEALQASLIPEFLAHATRDGFQVFATRITDDGQPYRVEPIEDASTVEGGVS